MRKSSTRAGFDDVLVVETNCERCGRQVQCNMPKSRCISVVVWTCRVCEQPNITAWDVVRDREAAAELGDFAP